MFYINSNQELTVELLQKMINKFNVEVQPKLKKNKNYYDGIQAILNKRYTDASKPCSRTVVNYMKDIADSYCGYMATPSYISYSSTDDIEDIMNVLRYNDYQAEDSDFLLDALIYGIAYELMYIDSDSQVRFKLIEPTSCFGVCDNSLTGDLLYFVRMYEADLWDETDKYFVDVYSNSGIKHYEMSGQNGYLKFLGEEAHYFSQCPANVFTLPDEKSVFECVLSLQDAVNEIFSSEIDDYSAFCDAFLVIMNADADIEDIASMKENRVLVLPDGASAQWLTKNMNDAQVENILKRAHDSIYRIAKCPDFSSESFVGGVSSGIAIQYRLSGMEHKAGIIEGRMKKALQRRVEIICGIASMKLGVDVFRDIEITFKRNIPEDITSTINIVNALKGTVSDATLLAQIPFVSDVPAELEAVQAQKQSNMELYNFSSTGFDEEDDV